MFCPEASGAGNLCAAPDKSRLRNEGQIHFQSALSKAALLGGKQSSPGAWDEAQGVPEVLGGGEWEPTVHSRARTGCLPSAVRRFSGATQTGMILWV